ncbi:MAG: D-glycero-beta-D-manno-heptose-7-phosphate kinase [Planctomycetes bacterium]|nr:D-glycero-beta-D-manno-heptose-7-phosphate kinase [Planctomycetota bacterium]NUQ34945.1 D-glycero-beta-D-manno-heptose-7-phosphate kinase [Planctomycetaceae bacterium]
MQHLLQAVNSTRTPRILVVGDLILDHYVRGSVSRISPEAPIPVVAVGGEEYKLGGAANVAANIISMGGKAELIGVTGNDQAGTAMARLARECSGLTLKTVRSAGRPTTVKTRLVAQHQQMMRVDYEKSGGFPRKVYQELLALCRKALTRADLVIVSDYGKGVLDDGFTRALIAAVRNARVPVIVDPKGRDYSKYRGATSVTPNRGEAEAATGIACNDDAHIKRCANALLRNCALDFALITLSADGVALLTKGGKLFRIPAVARSVYDVTGAGDTFIATLGVFLAQGTDAETAAQLANTAAGIKCGRFGAAAITRDEVRRAITAAHEAFDYHAKIVSARDMTAIARGLKRDGSKVVFTNGCFDILHAGHVTYLHYCKQQGDVLVVGMNTDASVRERKGSGRPINHEHDRARVLAALADVDFVVSFESEQGLEELIRAVSPAVLVKGADWKDKQVRGGAFVKKQGGKVLFAPLLKGRSTSGTIEKMRKGKP